MTEDIPSVPGDRDTVATDGQLTRSRSSVNRKLLPVLFGTGIAGGCLITTLLVLSAHAMIWPAAKDPEQKAGTARTVSEQQAVQQDAALRAINGGLAPYSTATPGSALGPNGQPLVPALNGASSANPAEPRLSKEQQLALAAQRAPIMGYTGGLGSGGGGVSGSGEAQRGNDRDLGVIAVSGEGPLVGGQGGPEPASGFVTTPAAQSDLGSKLPHSRIEVARATIIGDRSFLVAAGRTIPCTLQTAINSTQAGIISCVIGQDVYSENGRVVMLDKGTKVLGQYTGGIRQGQARLFVVWTRALTPRGVAIDLDSPASDEIGRAGIGGTVDTMFWQRFGAALMFSVLEDAGSIASSHFAGYGTNTTQVPAQTSSNALNGAQNIQPILKANQGQTVAIQVAKDFDFGSVYDVRIKTRGDR